MIEHPCWRFSPMRRWSRWLLGSLWVVLALNFAACNGGSDGNDGGSDGDNGGTPMATLNPGETFMLGITETLTMSGEYLLPVGAASITTVCNNGQVAVTFEIPPDPPRTNTCGSGSQRNIVTGASSVTYAFDAGESAEVTVN